VLGAIFSISHHELEEINDYWENMELKKTALILGEGAAKGGLN
jgi:hypothetical protein